MKYIQGGLSLKVCAQLYWHCNSLYRNMVYKKSASNKRKHVPASHFKVAEVTMRPLNDPLPLGLEDHPRRSSPPPFLTSYNTVEQDLIDAASVTTSLPSKPRSQISQQPNEITYPSVSNGTWTRPFIESLCLVLQFFHCRNSEAFERGGQCAKAIREQIRYSFAFRFLSV